MGIAKSIYSFIGIVSGLLAVGMQSRCTHELGKGDIKNFNRIFSAVFYVSIVVSLIFGIAVFLGAGPMVVLMGASGKGAALIKDAADYLRGLAIGIPPTIIAMMLSVACQLDSAKERVRKSALVYFVGDVVLDYVAVKLHLGVFGISRTEQHSKNSKGHIEYYFSDEGTLKCEHPAEDLYIDNGAIELIQEINVRYPESDFLFFDGHFIRLQAFSKRLSHICKTIGIPPRTLHKARKTYATRLINAGVDQMLVKTQLRHKDITTTLKHYYRDNKSAAEKAARIEAVLSAY